MNRFADPIKSTRDLSIIICLSGAATFAFHVWSFPNPELAGLNLLGWLIEPALFAALYISLARGWGSVGLIPRFKGQLAWYLFAFALPPSLTGILLLINQISGYVPLTPQNLQTGMIFGLASAMALAIKNVVEEFIFRGFFTSRFAQSALPRILGHILTGLISAIWHLVYWFALLPNGKIAEVSGLSAPIFVILGIIALTLHAILLGEMRLITGSIWAGIILHTINNIFLIALVAANAVPRGDFMAMLLTPVDFGIIYAVAMATIGLALLRMHQQ